MATDNRQSQPSGGSDVPSVEFRHVKVDYTNSNKAALNDVSFSVGQGEIVLLIGSSGSGKSTTIKLINRTIVPDSGDVIVGGVNTKDLRPSRIPYFRRNIGTVFQDYKLLENKTCYENVAFAMECVGKPRRKIAKLVPEVLKLVGLADAANKYPGELSGGEQQRISIARAIVNQPSLLICDEPTGNLDPQNSQAIISLLLTINKVTGATLIIATHDKEMVNALRKRVVHLHKGVLVYDEENGTYHD